RITSTTMITKIHSASTKPRRSATSVSSLIGRSPGGRAGGGEQHGQPGAADLQQGAVLEGDGGADPVPVDEGAVGGAEIGGDQGRIGLGAQLEVMARDPGVLEDDVGVARSEEHTSELQSRFDLVCRLLLEKKKNETNRSDATCRRIANEL